MSADKIVKIDNGFMSMEVGLTGLKEIEQRLSELYPKVAKRHVRAAMRDGAKIIVKNAQRMVPQKTQNLGHSLSFRFLKQKGNLGLFSLRFGWITNIRTLMGRNYKRVANDGYYGHWVEYGHRIVPRGGAGAARREKKTGNDHGYQRVQAKPHFVPAYERGAMQMINYSIEYLQKKIMKEWEA